MQENVINNEKVEENISIFKPFFWEFKSAVFKREYFLEILQRIRGDEEFFFDDVLQTHIEILLNKNIDMNERENRILRLHVGVSESLISSYNIGNNTSKYICDKLNEWFELYEFDVTLSKEYEKCDFTGDFLFSASPIKKKGFGFIINWNDALIKAPSNLDIAIDNIYINHTKGKTKNFKINAIDVINVGQGLFSKGYNNNKLECVFDIGLPFEFDKRKYKTALDEFKIIENCTILISHFDSDHILGITQIDQSKYNKLRFIIPKQDAKIISNTAKRLIYYFYNLNGSNSFNIINNRKKMGNVIVNVGVDNGTIEPTKINQTGLISIVKSEKCILIPGDSMYDNFLPSLTKDKTEFDYIIIPHHGMELYETNYAQEIIDSRTEGILCVGSNKHKHPQESHLDEYTSIKQFNNYCNNVTYNSAGNLFYFAGDTIVCNIHGNSTLIMNDIYKIKLK